MLRGDQIRTQNVPLDRQGPYEEVEADSCDAVVVEEGEYEGDAQEDHHVDVIEERVESVPPLLGQRTVEPDVEGVQEDDDYLQSYQDRDVQISPPTPCQKVFIHF